MNFFNIIKTLFSDSPSSQENKKNNDSNQCDVHKENKEIVLVMHDYDISNTEFKAIPNLKEIVCDTLRENFDVKTCDNGYYWFSPWENHRRKVFRLYVLKGYSAPIFWGYNYDFVPWESSVLSVNRTLSALNCGELKYFRTEKSVRIDYKGEIFPYIDYDFWGSNDKDIEKNFYLRKKYFLHTVDNYSDELKDIIENNIKEIVRRNMPFMLDWFEKNDTYEEIIAGLDKSIEKCEAVGGLDFGDYWLRGFLYAKLHNMDKAIADIEKFYSLCDSPIAVPEKVIKKLHEVDKLK